MADPGDDREPWPPDLDENGVDLAQIRQMLELEPARRLTLMTELMRSLLATRAWNDNRRSG